uniref:Putative secreted protein n=1 Tax=Anopheles marajoara TaxID=58244 RepID=A0A2M4CCG2_9DIPT
MGVSWTSCIGASTASASGASPSSRARLLSFQRPVFPLIVRSSHTHRNSVSTTISYSDRMMCAMKNANTVIMITGAM